MSEMQGICYIVEEDGNFNVIPPNEYGSGLMVKEKYQGVDVLRVWYCGAWQSFDEVKNELTQTIGGLEQELEEGKTLSFGNIKESLQADTQGKDGESRYNVALETGHKPG